MKEMHIEAQRIMSVLGETLDRLNFIGTMPQDPNLRLMKALLKTEDKIVQSVKRQWHVEEIMNAMQDEEGQQLKSAKKKVIQQTQTLCRDLVEHASALEVIYQVCNDNRSKSVSKLIQVMSEMTDITYQKLMNDDALKLPRISDQNDGKNNSAKEEIQSLENKLQSIRSAKQKDILQWQEKIQKYTKKIDHLNQNSAVELNVIETEMKKILDKAHDDHLAQMNVLLDHTSKLEDTRKTLDKEHQEEELIWRKKLSKVGTEVKNAVVRYDTEMNQNKEQLHSLQASFHAEQDEFAQLSEYFQKVDEEQARIDAEEKVLAAFRDQQMEAQNKLNNCAIKIQKIFRGRQARKKMQKGGKKNEKKGKK